MKETAEYLSILTGEKFSESDVQSLVAEGALPLHLSVNQQGLLKANLSETDKKYFYSQLAKELTGTRSTAPVSTSKVKTSVLRIGNSEIRIPKSMFKVSTGVFPMLRHNNSQIMAIIRSQRHSAALTKIALQTIFDGDEFCHLVEINPKSKKWQFPAFQPESQTFLLYRADIERMIEADQSAPTPLGRTDTSAHEAAVQNQSMAVTTTASSHPAKDSSHPDYAPELHAALEVWESLYLKGEKPAHLEHSPSSERWLAKNLGQLGATQKTRITRVSNPGKNKNPGK